MPTEQQQEVQCDNDMTRGYIKSVLTLDADEPVTLYLREDQRGPLVRLPFEIWQLWARINAPRPRLIPLERNEAAARTSELYLNSQAESDVKVKARCNDPDYAPDDHIVISTVSQFLRDELNQNPKPSQATVVIMNNISPPVTTWDRVWMAGLIAWVKRTSPKLRLRCFITSKGPPIGGILPGLSARVIVQSALRPSIQGERLNHGTIEDRVRDAVKYTNNIFREDPNARVAFVLDSETSALVLKILKSDWEEMGSTGPSGHSQLWVKYKTFVVTCEDDLVSAIEMKEVCKMPVLFLLTTEIQQLDAYELDLRSVVVFEPMQTTLQYLKSICKMVVTRCCLSGKDIEICKNMLGNCPDGSRGSLVRYTPEGEISRQLYFYPVDMMAFLFLAIGFGVESPLAPDSMVINKLTEPQVPVFIQRLLGMKAIVTVDENNDTATWAMDSIASRRFQLGMGRARNVFDYMVTTKQTDLNNAWLQVSTASLKLPINYIELDFSLVSARLAAILDSVERFSPILFVDPELDIETVMRAATELLPEVHTDWQERGNMWYTILLVEMLPRGDICLDPQSTKFCNILKIAEGLFVDAGRLGRVNTRVIKMETKLHIRGPLFENSTHPSTREHVEATYTILVRAVVDAYPQNLVMLYSTHLGGYYAQYAWDVASRVCHRVNDQSFNRVRLRKDSGEYRPVFAVYFTLRSVGTDPPSMYVEDLLVLPKEISDNLGEILPLNHIIRDNKWAQKERVTVQ
ncbi:hypothetical protein F5B21DRAFT_506022 [Xylaria acuta]|nr:hypothetical protein F5B21DRAFT_506022 [Xylaria acuta]